MPRQIKNLIYYDKESYSVRHSWPFRVFCRYIRPKYKTEKVLGDKVKIRKTPLYRQALAYSRNKYIMDFNEKLRKSSALYSKQGDYFSFRKVIQIEKSSLQTRDEVAKFNYLKHLKKQKYG